MGALVTDKVHPEHRSKAFAEAMLLCFFTDGGCRSRTFTPDNSTAVCIDWKKVRLQELLGADQQQQGRVPRSVEVKHNVPLVLS
jgi:hypothetical protein